MLTTKIKICGMKKPDNIQAVAGLNPDYMGFIFYESSPRFVGHSFRMPSLAEEIKKVGVFVDESIEKVFETKNHYQIDYLQLHGHESVADCKTLQQNGAKLIKAFSIHAAFNFNVVRDYEPFVDLFLFDTAGKFPGGNGRAFDWDQLDQYNGLIPFLLSGGLNINNIIKLKRMQHPQFHGIDLNSGVENYPGEKSLEKINELLTKLK